MNEPKVTALIVDDSIVMRKALRAILEKHNVVIVGEADNGLEAIRLHKELKPDLITLDIVMPKFNGVEALRLIKGRDAAVRVLMVTAMSSMNKVEECAKLGAEQYIVKPFEEDKIVKTLKKLFADRIP